MCDDIIFLSSDDDNTAQVKKPKLDYEISVNQSNKNNTMNSENSGLAKPEPYPSIVTESVPEKNEDSKKGDIFKPTLVEKEKVPIPNLSVNIFSKFINTCQNKKCDDVAKNILKKVEERYDQLDSNAKNDEDFRIFLQLTIQRVCRSDNDDDFYAHLKAVYDEMKRLIQLDFKKVLSQNDSESNNLNVESESNEKMRNLNDLEEKDEQFEEPPSENEVRLKKLEEKIAELRDKIQKLDNEEIDFNEDEDSAYVKVDLYKRKLLQLSQIHSKIAGDDTFEKNLFKKMLKRKNLKVDISGVEELDDVLIKHVNGCIKSLNKLKHIQKLHVRPDYFSLPNYCEILKLFKKQNEKTNLGLSLKELEKSAKSSLEWIVEYFKLKRVQESKQFLFETTDADPAENNLELLKELEKNQHDSKESLNNILKKYVEKQKILSPEELKCEEMGSDISDSDIDEEKPCEAVKTASITVEEAVVTNE